MSKVVKLGSALTKIAGSNDAIQKVKLFLDTGFPPLNKAISGRYDGGMPVGRIVEMFGPESSGKTAIATEVMKAAQQMGGIAMYRDHERSFDARLAAEGGLLVEEGDPWIFKAGGTFEESIDETIDIAMEVRKQKLIDPEAPIVVVYDSLASMNPRSKVKKDKDKDGRKGVAEQSMHDNTALARATSSAFPVLVDYAQDLNMLIIFLNQTRMKLGVMFGDPTTTPGGNAPKFYSSVRIQIGKSMIKDTKTNEYVGQEVTAKCIKNKVSAPFKQASWRFMFQEDGTGKFDVVRSLIEYMVENKMLEKDGNYIVWEGSKYYASQLAKKIETDGTYDQLKALLPPDVDEDE